VGRGMVEIEGEGWAGYGRTPTHHPSVHIFTVPSNPNVSQSEMRALLLQKEKGGEGRG